MTQSILTSLLAVLLTAVSGVFGAPFLRVMRHIFGPARFYLVGFFVVASLIAVKAFSSAILVGTIWMTLGIYTELEIRKLSWWLSGMISVLSGMSLSALGLSLMAAYQKTTLLPMLMKSTDEFILQLRTINPKIQFESQLLVQQIPSLIAIFLVIVLAVGLIFERGAYRWMKITPRLSSSRLKLLDYRLPDFFLWITMSAFLLAMVSGDWKVVSVTAMNVANTSVILYFLQGLAVIETLLISMKAGVFTRVLTYFLVLGQLLIFVSAIGFFDYWLDFRSRIQKWMKKASEDI